MDKRANQVSAGHVLSLLSGNVRSPMARVVTCEIGTQTELTWKVLASLRVELEKQILQKSLRFMSIAKDKPTVAAKFCAKKEVGVERAVVTCRVSPSLDKLTEQSVSSNCHPDCDRVNRNTTEQVHGRSTDNSKLSGIPCTSRRCLSPVTKDVESKGSLQSSQQCLEENNIERACKAGITDVSHKVTPHLQKPYGCSTCGLGFSSVVLLECHIKNCNERRKLCNSWKAGSSILMGDESTEVISPASGSIANPEPSSVIYPESSAMTDQKRSRLVDSELTCVLNPEPSCVVDPKPSSVNYPEPSYLGDTDTCCVVDRNRANEAVTVDEGGLETAIHEYEDLEPGDQTFEGSTVDEAGHGTDMFEYKDLEPRSREHEGTTGDKGDETQDDIELTSFGCAICVGGFRDLKDLNKHLRTHKEFKTSYSCPICNETFVSNSSWYLTLHMRRVHRPCKHKCDLCQERFHTKTDLKSHRKVHTGVKPFSCSLCGKTFSKETALYSHRIMHSGEKPHKCETCSKGFATGYGLVRHRRIHMEQKPYKCPFCDKSFAERSKLVFHERRHTTCKTILCHLCGRQFYERKQLNSHLKTHSGEKSEVCEICGVTFTSQSSLKLHLKRHARTHSMLSQLSDASISTSVAKPTGHVSTLIALAPDSSGRIVYRIAHKQVEKKESIQPSKYS